MIGLHFRGAVSVAPLTMVVSLSLAAGCAQKAQKPQRQTATVAVASARRATVPYTIDVNGVVTPIQTAAVASQVDGIILEVNFQEGQEVTKNQVLFRIDPRPYRNAYDQARGALARDRAAADNALHEAKRYVTLAEKDYVTKEQADQEKATADAAVAVLQADSAAIATAKFNLDNAVIRAPIAGKTGGLLVRAGNLVHAAGGTPLVVINQIRPIFVRFPVPASDLQMVLQYGAKGGLPVTAVPGGALPSAGPTDTTAGPQLSAESSAPAAGGSGGSPGGTQQGISKPVVVETGSLSFVDNAVDTTTETVMLKATFPNASGMLWAGQFASTTLKLFDEVNALVVPVQAITQSQRGSFVYTVDATNSAQQKPVVVERIAGDVAVISSGIADGDRVVTDGQSRLTPGMSVSIRSPNGAPTAGGGGRTLGRGNGGNGAGAGGAGGGGGGRRGGRRGGAATAVGDGGGRPK